MVQSGDIHDEVVLAGWAEALKIGNEIVNRSSVSLSLGLVKIASGGVERIEVVSDPAIEQIAFDPPVPAPYDKSTLQRRVSVLVLQVIHPPKTLFSGGEAR
jgi:hypothetical protein